MPEEQRHVLGSDATSRERLQQFRPRHGNRPAVFPAQALVLPPGVNEPRRLDGCALNKIPERPLSLADLGLMQVIVKKQLVAQTPSVRQ